MQIVELLEAFSNPETMQSLSAAQRLEAGLVTTLLGMGITFLALIVLMVVTALFEKVGGEAQAPPKRKGSGAAASPGSEPKRQVQEDDEELVTAITAALAVMLDTSAESLVVRNVKRVDDAQAQWSRAGLAEQLQSRM